MPDDGGSTSQPEAPEQGSQQQQQSIEPAAFPLPPVIPPATKAPVQFNQQVNLSIQQIPTTAWDRLAPEQIVDISKMIVTQIEATDKRHFDYAMDEVKRSASGKKTAIFCGSLITIAGFGATLWLALTGHDMACLAISLPLGTILAMIIGNRFLDRSGS